MKTTAWRILPAVLGAVGFALRYVQQETAFEPDTLLPVPGAAVSWALGLYLAAAGALLLLRALREPREKRISLEAGFCPPPQRMLPVLVCAVMLVGAGGALLLYEALPVRDAAALALGGCAVIAAACLFLALVRWRRGESCGGLLTAPALMSVVWLLLTYRQYADYPVLEALYVQILAIAAFTYAFYQTAAYGFGLGSRRTTRFILPASTVLGLTALADDLSLGLMCLYVGCTAVLCAFSLLERPAAPDGDAPGAGEEA